MIDIGKFKFKTCEMPPERIDWGLTFLSVPESWQFSRGSGTRIALLDTGIIEHIDVIENLAGGINFTNSYTDKDINGHSTACGGIIAAGQNSFGIIGVSPQSKLYCAKVADDNGNCIEPWLEAGLNWAFDIGADVVNVSLGGSEPLGQGIEDAINRLYDKGVPVVCAAGNDSKGVNYPAKYPKALAISAIDSSSNITNFSSRGPEIILSAPGKDIWTTWTSSNYISISGTSFSAPIIVGCISIILSKHRVKQGSTPINSVSDIIQHLQFLSRDLGEIGKDEKYGYGIIDFSKGTEDF
jgi:subtilisin